MRLLLALTLVAITHGCIRTPEEPKKPEPSDEEIWQGIQEAMKRPVGFDERSWRVVQKKIRAWDYDGWLEKLGMAEKDFFMQKTSIQNGNYPLALAFFDFGENPYWRNFSFVNPRTQMLDGFLPRIMQKACDYCGGTCGMVNVGTNGRRCFDEETLTGSGLSNNEFAACVGLGSTPKRANVFKFGGAVSLAPGKQLWIRRTSTDINTDADVNGRKVGIPGPMQQYGQYDVDCLKRNWPDVMPSEVIATANDDMELVTQLLNGEIDVAMGPVIPEDADPETLEAIKDIKRLGEPFQCVKDGVYELMQRKDKDLRLLHLCYWYGVIRTGEYKKMCDEYGGMVKEYCIDFDAWMREMNMGPKPDMDEDMKMDGM